MVEFVWRKAQMRVFISWSGERSHAVAIALKNFIGDIIQSVTPFVSAEDIINGERWASRLKEELQENQYGILSITKGNKESPWLLFEAGALSNSEHNIPVVPFLFDIEPSELTGSPLLQFQATIYYSKENVRKLINEINNACGDTKLDSVRLDRAFDRCYDEFEAALKSIAPELDEFQVDESDTNRVILEELLDLTRGNQKLLSHNDMLNINVISQLEQFLERYSVKSRRNANNLEWRSRRVISPMILNDLLRFDGSEKGYINGMLICISFFREDMPWIYDAGRDIINSIKSNRPLRSSLRMRTQQISDFGELVDLTFSNHLFSISGDKEEIMMLRELAMNIVESLMQRTREEEYSISDSEIRREQQLSSRKMKSISDDNI